MCQVKSLDECQWRLVAKGRENNTYFSETYSEPISDNFLTAREQLVSRFNIPREGIDNVVAELDLHPTTVYVTRHAAERLRQRNGWNKKTILRMVKIIYENGKRETSTRITARNKGRAKDVIQFVNDAQQHALVENIVYGQDKYVFRNRVLITMYHLETPGKNFEKYVSYKRGRAIKKTCRSVKGKGAEKKHANQKCRIDWND